MKLNDVPASTREGFPMDRCPARFRLSFKVFENTKFRFYSDSQAASKTSFAQIVGRSFSMLFELNPQFKVSFFKRPVLLPHPSPYKIVLALEVPLK